MLLDGQFKMIVTGPSGCGKTVFVFGLLDRRHKLITPSPKHIFYFYGVWQKLFEEYKYVNFIEGLPDISLIPQDELEQCIIIIDDQMESITEDTVKLFTKYSHHIGFPIIFITQNIYHKNKHTRDLSLNANVIVAFDHPRDRTLISTLSRQLFPGNSRFMIDVFKKIVLKAHGYLYVDLRINCPEHLRLRTDVFADHQTAFLPKDFNIRKWNARVI